MTTDNTAILRFEKKVAVKGALRFFSFFFFFFSPLLLVLSFFVHFGPRFTGR